MRKIITFLGTRPLATQYEYRGTVYTGSVFAEALRQFETYDQMLVCATDEAKTTSWPVLEALGDARIQKVSIPRGETTAEMWQMFDAITGQVNEGDTVIFDITHGLRSLPFLVFLFAAYLKSAKHVTIQAIYYGALELGNSKEGKPAPVINLSQFVSILDWLTASDRFIRFGDSGDLAELVHKSGRYKTDNPLIRATDALDDLSQALRLIRPLDAMRISAELPDILEAARPVAEEIPAVRPYSLLVDDLKNAYASFALPEPFGEAELEAGLMKQRDLIGWYIDHQQWVQAVSLAREWLITWAMWHLGEYNILERTLRESVADTMSQDAQRRKDARERKVPFKPLFLQNVPEISEVLGLWLSLTGVRNDIDHAGMRDKRDEAAALIKSVKTLCRKLQQLPVQKNA